MCKGKYSTLEDRYNSFSIGARVKTNKDYEQWCGNPHISGTVIKKDILPNQLKRVIEHPLLYEGTNPYVLTVCSDSGEEERLNVIWLDKVQK
jgi:hypothetical protein